VGGEEFGVGQGEYEDFGGAGGGGRGAGGGVWVVEGKGEMGLWEGEMVELRARSKA
jgi:hypothetical protein